MFSSPRSAHLTIIPTPLSPHLQKQKPVNLRTKDSKGKTKAIKIFVDCFPLLATHGWAGGVGKTPPQVMEMAKVRE